MPSLSTNPVMILGKKSTHWVNRAELGIPRPNTNVMRLYLERYILYLLGLGLLHHEFGGKDAVNVDENGRVFAVRR